ncbi:ArsR family transcriptional regulator [Sphingobacterium shayense]|uniref:ArsR family transcriptional regulator n=1 Tax=Sphingobacterium shayense TaxID=626343 RepID=UPI001553A798|nr:ArsR family transcriptional regulator [Sphingobacterium shayense]NQD70224.1 ArsR family transcriptional regulator [Sphingobacterium shayense]
MLDALITSKTRLKLLIKFFVSASNTGYLRGIAEEFDESTNSIRKELNQLTEAGFLERKQDQKKVVYRANIAHPLFSPVQKLIHSFLGIDKVVEQVLERAGDVDQVILVGPYARGLESSKVDIVVQGEDLDKEYLMQLAEKTSNLINKEVSMHFDREVNDAHIIVYKRRSD